ncbi:NADH-ubiquinone oxidoreductase-F iron-sulfur binding region domain-containing protein [Prosthecobacter sp.]|uniref:NADH-ubiquinone oxidoreductase-F iron-sulfur binding region domain-containing protein n=1 Tax=Prosthecobacter sp. TaxID=1965333 RepID=UPI002ABB87A7|nr:NADH-ubiquinone oxidoreductase-F iron-sulfur binding region domain-containing protein [Prosthecobacter sp.]MDZ4404865.1 NADH-ubiquinone oxidoreductase-F iron-sulfur binding region domain-containing protein [Prosthecobacter sp.]
MSKNLSALSFRKGVEKNVFERMVDAADKAGTAAKNETVHPLGADTLFGDAVTLGAVSFYDFLKKENEGKKVFICNGSACLCAGTQDKLHHTLETHFKQDEIGHICCLGRCHQGGALQYQGKNYSGQSDTALGDLFKTGKGDHEDRYAVVSHLQPAQLTAEFPGIDEYYAPFKKLITTSDRDALGTELKDSGLRGRGGAGFPLHFKWSSCRAAEGVVKYIVCNADEGDPGAYIDKYLMEQQPHSVLLGMMVAGWFAGAENGILYIRAEYPDSVTIINEAIEDLRAAGLLGQNILDTGFNFMLKSIKGAGAYICGEETALLASLEGQRPEVRTRPPFPTIEGLFRKPTIVNNVETFSNIHAILSMGGKAYAQIGTPQSTGPKLLSLDSHFANPGIYEVAMGTPLQTVIDLAGGFKTDIKAIQIGGPLGGIVPISHIDQLTVDFESFKQAGFLLGHAGVVSIPETLPMIEYIQHLFQFTADESCGKCFPCRLGSTRGKELIAKARGDASYKIDRELITDLLDTMEQTSLCALGGGVPLPIKNALEHFQSELAPFFKA